MDLYDWAVTFDSKLTSLALEGGGAYGKWVEYTDSGGDWEGDAINELPTWDNLADILGEAVITPVRGELSREWAHQRYRALDKMRWYATEEGAFEDVLTSYSKVESGNDVSWADAVSNFNGASYSSGSGNGYIGNHYGLHTYDGIDERWEIYRAYADVDLSGIATNISHRLTWYKYAEKASTNLTANNNAYVDPDDGATENTLHKEYTSSIATTATRTGIILGSNSGNNAQSEPSKPSGVGADDSNANGYEYADTGSIYFMLWELNADANGLIFVT
jgi:hypothetical protein